MTRTRVTARFPLCRYTGQFHKGYHSVIGCEGWYLADSTLGPSQMDID